MGYNHLTTNEVPVQFTHADAVRLVAALTRDTIRLLKLIDECVGEGVGWSFQHLKDTADHNLMLIDRFQKECGHGLQDNFPDIGLTRRLLADKK